MKHLIVFSLLMVPAFSGNVLRADQAHDDAVKAIEESGGSVRQIADDDDRVAVDFHLLRDGVSDETIAPAAKLQNVYEVHLGGAPITDNALGRLETLTSIERLHLENTKITDAGLSSLKKLTNLKYLNLYGTTVTDAGLERLTTLKSLEKLYLWQTKVTDAGAAKLQKALPDLEINRGWDTGEQPQDAAETNASGRP